MGVPISAARASLPDLVDRVEAGDEIVLTRHGRPVAVLISPATLRTRRAGGSARKAAELAALLDSARQRRPKARLTTERAEALVAEVDRNRDA